MKKLKVNYYTYFLIFASCITGMFKECLIFLFIILWHELGHIVAIKYYHYPIKEVEILPFGGVTRIEKDLNSPLKEDLIISMMGIIMQLFLLGILIFLKENNLISFPLYSLFLKYNLSIMFFNLLPIIPLDGSIFLRSILEKFCSFLTSQIIIIIISLISVILFIYCNYYFALNNYLICLFLIYKIYNYFKDLKYLKNRFFLERFLKNYPSSQIKVISNLKYMQKERKHFVHQDKKIIPEKEALKTYFKRKMI